MKFLKKINLGLVLTIIVVLAVIIYCIALESQRKADKEIIKKSCEDFIDLTDKYYCLPDENQVIGISAKDINLTDYENKMEQDLKSQMKDSQSANIQKTILSNNLENQFLDTQKIAVNFDRKITKILNYSFDGNQVTVTFNSTITIKQKYNNIINEETGETDEKINQYSFEVSQDTITLEKIDGNWKVVYANLQYDNSYRNYAF